MRRPVTSSRTGWARVRDKVKDRVRVSIRTGGRESAQYQGRNRGQESIQGRGSARSWNETRDLTYSCVVDTRQNQVLSGAYQYSGNSIRTNDRRQLR